MEMGPYSENMRVLRCARIADAAALAARPEKRPWTARPATVAGARAPHSREGGGARARAYAGRSPAQRTDCTLMS